MKEYITHSPEETAALGEKIGQSCQGGEVILLLGNLGAGKTCFTQGLAKGLGVKGPVNSPTFNLMKVYKIKTGVLCHIDAYRLDSGNDLIAIGLDDYLKKKDAIVVIEWAERVKDIWPKNKIKIEFKNFKDGRKIKIF